MGAQPDVIVEMSRDLIERGSKSFASAARLLPRDIRNDAYMLYAWCRYCDDQIDDQDLGFAVTEARPGTPIERLAELRDKTRRAIAGDADEPVFVALSRVTSRHAIPERHPLELLRGFEMDVEGRAYRTLDDTLEYCYHVAGVVGVMMAIIMGVRDRETLNRASDLGLAFQLTNIARDVMGDAQAGRIYLPSEMLERAGVPDRAEVIASAEHRRAVFGVTAELLETADRYYRSALYGMGKLPLGAAVGIGAARRIYRDIGRIVRARREEAWDRRAIVGRSRKVAGAISGAMAALRAHTVLKWGQPPPRDGLWTMPGLGEAS